MSLVHRPAVQSTKSTLPTPDTASSWLSLTLHSEASQPNHLLQRAPQSPFEHIFFDLQVILIPVRGKRGSNNLKNTCREYIPTTSMSLDAQPASTAGGTGDAEKGQLSKRWKVTSACVCLRLMWQVSPAAHSESESILAQSCSCGPAGGTAGKDELFITDHGCQRPSPPGHHRHHPAANAPASSVQSCKHSANTPVFTLKMG